MADLSIKVAGVDFKNPVWLASGEASWSFQGIKRAVDAGAGGIVAKSMASKERAEVMAGAPRSRYCLLKDNHEPVRRGKIPRSFTLYSFSRERPDEDQWMQELKQSEEYAAQHGAHVIGSLIPHPGPDTIRLAKRMEQIGLKMLEVDVTKPFRGEIRTKDEFDTSSDFDDMVQYIKPIARAVSIPVFAKLSPMQTNLVVTAAYAVEECGAAGVTCHNRFAAFLVDIETGKPLLPALGRVGGPWMLPLSLRWVSKIYQRLPGIPILGSSGAYDWRDAVQFLMAGATVTQYCSTVMFKGYKVLTSTVAGLDRYLDRKGYAGVPQIVGKATDALTTREVLRKSPEWTTHVRKSTVNAAKCTDCGRCVEQCWFNAMERKGEKDYRASRENCEGCGTCEIICPAEAIEWAR